MSVATLLRAKQTIADQEPGILASQSTVHRPISPKFKLVFLTATGGTAFFVLLCLILSMAAGKEPPPLMEKVIMGFFDCAKFASARSFVCSAAGHCRVRTRKGQGFCRHWLTRACGRAEGGAHSWVIEVLWAVRHLGWLPPWASTYPTNWRRHSDIATSRHGNYHGLSP